MVFKIDGIDFSSLVDVAGYKITPRREYGPAKGGLLNGSRVVDLLTIKKDLTVNIVATEQAVTSQLTSSCMKEDVQLQFNDPITNQTINGTYEPDIKDLDMAIESDSYGKTYWYGFQILFKEV